jgi:hypothetical protein
MTPTKCSDTIVFQTFRNHTVPNWIQRCLDSVQKWARRHGHDYSLVGDEFFDLCGREYLSHGKKNPRAITNLARLIATRQHLDAGYRRVIWMDADIFVFDPENLVFDFPAASLITGYAFGREVWIRDDTSGAIYAKPPVPHNAATYFTQDAVDLEILTELIRHIDAKREIVSNFQVGVGLLRGLQYSLMFPTFSHVGVFSPTVVRALANREEKVLRFCGENFRFTTCAGNLCLSHEVNEDFLWQAMDRLEEGAGYAINKYATETGAQLVPYDSEQLIGPNSATIAGGLSSFKGALRKLMGKS